MVAGAARHDDYRRLIDSKTALGLAMRARCADRSGHIYHPTDFHWNFLYAEIRSLKTLKH
jgi:hypothetical protein